MLYFREFRGVLVILDTLFIFCQGLTRQEHQSQFPKEEWSIPFEEGFKEPLNQRICSQSKSLPKQALFPCEHGTRWFWGGIDENYCVEERLFCDFLEIKDVILCGLKYVLYKINAVLSIKKNNYYRPGQIQGMLFKHCCHLSIRSWLYGAFAS